MKKIIIGALMLCCFSCLKAQYNLVPNPSFEVYDTCPNWVGQIYRAIPWTNPTNASPDYFNSCDTTTIHKVGVPANYVGNEAAKTGFAYALIATASYTPGFPVFNNYREYIEVELTETLLNGVNYCIRFYVSACDSSNFVSNNIGIYFSPVQVQSSNALCLPYVPQFENAITNNLNSRNGWTEVSGTYTAVGGEKFIVIGNFRDSTTTVATLTGWTSSTVYNNAAYYIDDILITPCDSLTGLYDQRGNSDYTIYPNPSHGYYSLKTKNSSIIKIEAYDVLGSLIFSKNSYYETKINIDLSYSSKGIYYLKIFSDKNSINYKLIKN